MSDIKTEVLRSRLPFWDRLREAQREALIHNCRAARYKKNSIIAGIGEDCGIIIVRRGRICACSVSEDGREVALLCAYSGDVCLLGAQNLVDTSQLNMSISAETEADVLIIEPQVYADICKSSIHAEAFTRWRISSHLSQIAAGLESMILHSPRRRIASYLCASSDRLGSNRVKATHELIAKHAGTAREVVSRTLGAMADEGIVELERGVIIVRDKVRLKNLI